MEALAKPTRRIRNPRDSDEPHAPTVEERAYTTAEVRNTLKKCGFSVIGIIPAEETGTGGTNGRFFAVARRNSGKTPEKRRKNTGKAGK